MAADPWAFLTELCRINDPPPQGKGIIRFEAWGHLTAFVRNTQLYRLLQVLKARQIGITWTLAGLGLHEATFNEGANVLILSKGELEATEVLARCKLMHRELPDEFRLSLGPGGATRMSFPAMDSQILALPATEDAGRTQAASLVICDEWDFHPYAESNYAAVKPTIDAGGRFIGVSTTDKSKVDSFFKRLWRLGDSSGFHRMFMGWDLRPGRDAKWYEETKRTYPDILKWEQEYPTTAEEAMAPSQGECFFDIDSLKRLLQSARTEASGVYRQPVITRRYAAWIDPAGMGKDRHSLSVMDCQTGEMVVDYTNTLPRDEFVLGAKTILDKFQQPLLGIESNGVGEAMLDAFRSEAINYPVSKLCKHGAKDEKLGVPSSVQLKLRQLPDLAEGIRQGSIILYSKEAIDECFSFVRQEKGPAEAAVGAHDDRVRSMAGANWVSKQAPSSDDAPLRSLSRHEMLTGGRRT